METEKIIKKIQSGLQQCSVTNKIPFWDVIFLIKSNGTIDLMNAMNRAEENIDPYKAFSISKLEKMAGNIDIPKYLRGALANWAVKKNVNNDTIQAKIFTKKEGDQIPSVYLYDGPKVLCELTINDLLTNK